MFVKNHSVVYGSDDAILDGFTITGGCAEDYYNPPELSDYCHYYGGGMINVNSSPSVSNCKFIDNAALINGGAIYNVHSFPTFTNCIFMDNVASGTWYEDGRGGAVYNASDSYSLIYNCTFYSNWAHMGGAIDDGVNTSVVVNSILWANGEPYPVGGTPSISYSTIEFGYAGAGNIDLNPLFMDADAGDLHLTDGSPCIDTADDEEAPDRDMQGNPRVDVPGIGNDGTFSDMGAYEYVP